MVVYVYQRSNLEANNALILRLPMEHNRNRHDSINSSLKTCSLRSPHSSSPRTLCGIHTLSLRTENTITASWLLLAVQL